MLFTQDVSDPLSAWRETILASLPVILNALPGLVTVSTPALDVTLFAVEPSRIVRFAVTPVPLTLSIVKSPSATKSLVAAIAVPAKRARTPAGIIRYFFIGLKNILF